MTGITEINPTKTKRKKVSKKLKSSWRKHVDTTDVENFLEEKRLEERLGDYSLLSNNELFTLDTSATDAKKLTSKQAKRLKLSTAPLKCLALLQPLTKVADPISKRNRVRTKQERVNELIKKKQALNKAKGIYKKKDLQIVKDMQLEKQRRDVKESKFEFNKDLWNSDEKLFTANTKAVTEIDRTVAKDSWIQGDVQRHILHGPGKLTKVTPKGVTKKPYVLNAIEIPHPGMSYNPSYEDHQDLLRIIAEKEQKIIKEEEHLKRVTLDMFTKVTPAQQDSNWMVEMSEGLKPDQTNPDASTLVDDNNEYKAINPPVKNKEKSTQQRRKQKEQQQLREQLHKAKIEKKKISDMHRLNAINKQIDRSEKKAQKLREKRLKKQEYKRMEAKRLGVNKFEEPDLDFNVTKDIAGNLRNIKKEGNLLGDRFRSLQKRNILEPTVIKAHKKAKVKKFDKPGHKEDTWKSGLAKKIS